MPFGMRSKDTKITKRNTTLILCTAHCFISQYFLCKKNKNENILIERISISYYRVRNERFRLLMIELGKKGLSLSLKIEIPIAHGSCCCTKKTGLHGSLPRLQLGWTGQIRYRLNLNYIMYV